MPYHQIVGIAYFFPDSCFYEFLPLNQRKEKNPITLLMDEVVQGETY
ncbi:GH3 family domain-containing protein, partial [Streptococcus parasanguinis]